jgi:hypothetical protein
MKSRALTDQVDLAADLQDFINHLRIVLFLLLDKNEIWLKIIGWI